jgi:uncharacterized protein with PQ loop repeat
MVVTTAYFVSGLGSLLSILLSISPIPKFISAVKSKDFSEVPYMFLLLTHIGAALWLLYALVAEIPEMVPVNLVSFVISLTLNAVYHACRQTLCVAAAFYVPSIAASTAVAFTMGDSTSVGLIAAVVNCFQQLTLLIKVYQSLQTKDPKYLDLNISVAVLINCMTWLLYGTLTANLIVIIPNFLGVSVAVVILFVYLWAVGVISQDKIKEEAPLIRV